MPTSSIAMTSHMQATSSSSSSTSAFHVEDSLTHQFKQLSTSPTYVSGDSSSSSSSSSSGIEELLIGHNGVVSLNGGCGKTSQNITENVPVPSSEHVAEIVGRQGCKIKALRAKTNTYIKTPVRGEPPMFTITGRREDVLIAKREIQLAADHFSQIRARRGSNSSSSSSSSSTTTSSSLSSNHGDLLLGSSCSSTTSSSSSHPFTLSPDSSSNSSSGSSANSKCDIMIPLINAINTTSPKLILGQSHSVQASSLVNVNTISSSVSSSASISPSLNEIALGSSSTSSSAAHHHYHHAGSRAFSISPTNSKHQQGESDSLIGNTLIMPPHMTFRGGASSSAGSTPSSGIAPPPLLPGQVCKKVTVPYQVVGLVVGPKGSTIKRIQHNTQTYIVTPSRDSQPVFEIQGMPENVEAAKNEIENYIQLRTSYSKSPNFAAGLSDNMSHHSQHHQQQQQSQMHHQSNLHHQSHLLQQSSSYFNPSLCANLQQTFESAGTADFDELSCMIYNNNNSSNNHGNNKLDSNNLGMLLSPQSNVLLQTVASVVDDLITSPAMSATNYQGNNNKNIRSNDSQQQVNGDDSLFWNSNIASNLLLSSALDDLIFANSLHQSIGSGGSGSNTGTPSSSSWGGFTF